MDPWLRFGGGADYEYIVLGAGPAGLQMGQHLARAGRSYVILEGGPGPGTFYRTFPRTLISLDKAQTGSDDSALDQRHDWSSLLSDEGDGPQLGDYGRRSFPPAEDLVRYLEDYARFHRLHIRCNTRIVRVERYGHFRLVDAEGNAATCRRLIVATGASPAWRPDPADADASVGQAGFAFDAALFAPECRPQPAPDGRFPAQTSEWESANVPGLYFAGTVTQADEGTTASGFLQGFRYNVRALHRMLERKYHGRNWPARWIEPTPDDLAEAVLARLNSSSALWQQSGFLHDVIVVSDDWDHAEHYEEMPLAYVQDHLLARHRTYYTVSLELGKAAGAVVSIVRRPTPETAEESALLHPVVRRWRGSQLIAEQRLPEELHGEWKKPEVHDAPLRAFFRDQLLAGDEEEKTAEHLLLRMAG